MLRNVILGWFKSGTLRYNVSTNQGVIMPSMTGLRGQIAERLHGIQQCLPLISAPAFQPNYARDYVLIGVRMISGIALSLIPLVGLYYAYPATALFMANYGTLSRSIGFCSIVGGLVGSLEVVRADRAAVHAIGQGSLFNQYHGVMPAAQILIDGSPSMCRMFLQNVTGEDLVKEHNEAKSCFANVVAEATPARLRHILQSGKIDPNEISASQQATIWKSVKTVDALRLLCEYGFNINVQDRNGWTPLMVFVERSQKSFGKEDDLLLVVEAL